MGSTAQNCVSAPNESRSAAIGRVPAVGVFEYLIAFGNKNVAVLVRAQTAGVHVEKPALQLHLQGRSKRCRCRPLRCDT